MMNGSPLEDRVCHREDLTMAYIRSNYFLLVEQMRSAVVSFKRSRAVNSAERMNVTGKPGKDQKCIDVR